ncbi:MAG: S1C family serine protease [Thermoleophilia bacterium]
MKKITNIISSAAAGVLGAALFFLLAYSIHLGGLGQTQVAVTTPSATDTQFISTPASTGGGTGPEQIYQKYADSVVQIVSTFQGQASYLHASQQQQGIGSGFVASTDGYILTNAHVVTDESSKTPQKASDIEVRFKNGKKVKASIVGYDLTSSDVAVVKVDPEGLELTPIPLGDSNAVKVGEPVVAIGSPFEYASTLTSGIISATKRTVESPSTGFAIQNALQTDAAINPGNSGGPLINSRGEVIGLNEQIATSSGGSEGVGFAVPINTAKQAMEQILSKGAVEYAWLGVIGQTVDAATAQKQGLSLEKGALLSEVVAGAPAEQVGIKVGDIIVRIDDQDMASMENVSGYLAEHRPGDKIKVTYIRDKESHDVEIELTKRPERV